MTELEKHYNKFCEDKRLTRRHGVVEYRTTMHYIEQYLAKFEQTEAQQIKILDVGAGTGKYSIALAQKGYDVTAVELVKYNLGILKQKNSTVKAFQGNALDLSRFPDKEFDLTLLLGPMYHLYDFWDKCKALAEAKRVTKPGGYIFVAYLMNEYGVLIHGFRKGHIFESLQNGKLREDFHCISSEEDLYEYVRLEDIDTINEACGVERLKILTPDGPANYMRQTLHEMDEDTFELFMKYHLETCERYELLGAAAHTLDILQKPVPVKSSEKKQKSSPKPDPNKQKRSKKRILVVEDDVNSSEMLQIALQEAGYLVTTVDDGVPAVEEIRVQPEGYYDLILMDIQMPVMDGYEATRTIRDMEGTKGTIPIWAVSANAFDEDILKGKACGMNGHVAKPIYINKLISDMDELLLKE